MIAHTTTLSTTRPFTTTEQELRQRAQQQLIQKRLNAQTLEQQGQKAFCRALRSTEQPPLLPRPALPARPAPLLPASREQIIPASLEAAMDRIRHPRPGTPAAWAVDAVGRARPIIEAHVKRRDARHNALMVYRALAQAAYGLIQVRAQQHAHTTTYTFFTVLDLLPVVTGLSSDQCERATRRLQDLGLIHKTSGALPTQTGGKRQYRGGTWVPTTFLNAEGQKVTTQACAGTWVAVLLRPAPGITARVISHELPPCPRDLTTDRKKGRTPLWRGVTAANEIRAAGLPLAIGGDNCRDAWFAYGDHDMLDTLKQAIRVFQADEPLTGSLSMAARTPADLIGRPDLGRIGVGLPAHLILFSARSLNVILSRDQSDRIVLHHGRQVTDPLPLHHDLQAALGLPSDVA